MSGFDVKGALKEGYTRKEIVDHLSKQQGYDAQAARLEGYSDDAILRHLVGANQVVEDKESPAFFTGLGGAAGAAYGVGDTGIRVAHGSFTKRIEEAAEKSAKKLAETFADDMASRRAANPLTQGTGSGDPVTNWTKQMHSGAHHGGRDFAEAHEIASKLKAAEKADPRFRAVQGSPILLDTRTADQVNATRGTAPVVPPKAPPTRTPFLQSPAVKIPFRAASLTGQLTAPAAGMASTGYGAAQAINRLQEGTAPRDKVAGAVNVLGAASGLGSLAHNPKIKYPATAVSGALNWLANLIATDKNEFEEPEQKAAGGVIQGYNKGKTVELIGRGVEGGLDLAKKIFTPKPTKIVKASEALAPREGGVAHLTQSDRLKSTEGELGGIGFSRHQLEKPEYAEAKAVWGVASPQEATKIINRNKKVPEGKSVWAPLIGSEIQHQTNPHVFQPMAEEFYNQIKLGKLPNETALKMQAALAKQQYGSGPRKGQLMFPDAPDVRDRDAIMELANTFENRGPLADVLFGAKGAGKRKGQIIDYEGMLKNMADPASIGAPTHSVGNRFFTLDNNAIYRPDLHSAFPHILTGEDLKVAYSPVPKEIFLKDYIDAYRDFTGKEPGTWAFTRKPLSVDITDKFLRRLDDAGYKEGGLAALEN